jgi:hypothetical protein
MDLKRVALADGAKEIARIFDADYPDWLVRVDIWHLLEKLSAALGTRRSLTPTEAAQKRRDWLDHLVSDDDAIEDILTELRSWKSRAKAVTDAIGYITKRKEKMRYASLRAQHLPIGSGQVEATCKQLVSVRMKRNGQRWKPEGAQAILNMRSLMLSHLWEGAMSRLLQGYVDDTMTPVISPLSQAA